MNLIDGASDLPASNHKTAAWKTGLSIIAGATLVSLFFAAQIYWSSSLQRPVSWSMALYWAFGDWYEWALFSPFIFWMCRRFPWELAKWKGRLAIYVTTALFLGVLHAALCACATLLQMHFTGAELVPFSVVFRSTLALHLHYNVAVFGLIVCAWNVWAYRRTIREREIQNAALASQLAEAQLQALRLQLNPHFLFNTLNAISSLMLRDVTRANKMMVHLSSLLRSTLESSDQQRIPLRQELELLSNYLEIEKVRFGERLRVEMNVQSEALEALVPSLILQPLVENAVRHAVEPNTAGGTIFVSAEHRDGALQMQVQDEGASSEAAAFTGQSSKGGRTPIGLNNTRRRLKCLYGELQSLSILRNPRGGVSAVISIPFQPATKIL